MSPSISTNTSGGNTQKNQQGNTNKVQERVRLTLQQYTLLEKQVLSSFDLRGTDPGSLGVQVGAERVLRKLREGFVIES